MIKPNDFVKCITNISAPSLIEGQHYRVVMVTDDNEFIQIEGDPELYCTWRFSELD